MPEALGSIAPISLEDFAASRASLSAALFRTTTLSSCFCLVFCGSSFLLLDGVSFDGAFFTGFLPSGVLRSLLSDGLLCSGLALSFLFSSERCTGWFFSVFSWLFSFSEILDFALLSVPGTLSPSVLVAVGLPAATVAVVGTVAFTGGGAMGAAVPNVVPFVGTGAAGSVNGD